MWRDVLRGRVWSASAYRVIADIGADLVLGCWLGAQLLAPTTAATAQPESTNDDSR